MSINELIEGLAKKARNLGLWTFCETKEIQDAAVALCKGSYQKDVILGWHNVSGSTLKGKARIWGGRYQKSRQSLLKALRTAGLCPNVVVCDHGAKVLVILKD